MIDITKIIGVGITGMFLALLLKKNRPEIAVAISLATGVIIFVMVSGAFATVIAMLEDICDKANIDFMYFQIMLKVIAVVYLTQLASAVSKDAGEGAIASKIEMGGKMCVVAISAPILFSLLESIVGMMP